MLARLAGRLGRLKPRKRCTLCREPIGKLHVNPMTLDHGAVAPNADEGKSAAGACSMLWVAG